MKTPTKFVKSLTIEQQEELRRIHKMDASSRRRMRAHVILLSFRRYAIDQIADIYGTTGICVGKTMTHYRKMLVRKMICPKKCRYFSDPHLSVPTPNPVVPYLRSGS